MNPRDMYKNIFITTQPIMIFKNYNPFLEPKKVDPVKAEKKIGRNNSCPCGSGLKYKKCCGSNREAK